MKRIVILVSDTGTGTNLQAIIDAIRNKDLHAEIQAVISDTKNSMPLDRAKQNDMTTMVCRKKDDLLPLLQTLRPDYIVLSGWKQFITAGVIDEFPNQILNLHPGLIPDSINDVVLNPDGTKGVWNKGKLTTIAIQNFFDTNATYGGSTIHFLTHEFDFGPVLRRCFEKVTPNDTIESFYTRLKKKENEMYVNVLQTLCNT